MLDLGGRCGRFFEVAMLKRSIVTCLFVVAILMLYQELVPFFAPFYGRQPVVVNNIDADSVLYESETRRVLKELVAKANRKGTGFDFSALTRHERDVLLVGILHEALSQAGFNEYFGQQIAEQAVQTVDALKAIGANEGAETLQQALKIFPNGTPPSDQWQRLEMLASLNSDQTAFLERQTWIFRSSMKGIPRLLFDYIETYKRFILASRSGGKA